jgi:diaminopimelate decarboxylase
MSLALCAKINSNDWFAKQRDLPPAQKGDLFVIYDTGAHSHSMGFQYNGKLRAPEVMLKGGPDRPEDVLVRKRETIPDLYANTVLPPEYA